MDWKKESEMFNRAADYYDKYRPGYPIEIINTLMKETGITQGSRLLEIGAGSGKATELFADKGFDILCIEPGKDLAAIGSKRFAERSVKFEVSRFEDYNPPQHYFDVIFSAQAFHWVPQPIGYEKCAYALKDGGSLALFWNMYITYENTIDNELVSISQKHGGFADFLSEEGCENRIKSIASGVKDSRLFSEPEIFRMLWTQKYTADEYYGFTLTGNTIIQKSEEDKKKVYSDIAALADKNKGIIERPYLCVLYLAQKL